MPSLLLCFCSLLIQRDITTISLILSHIVHTSGFKTFTVLLQYRLWSYGSHQRHQQTTSPIPHVYTIPLQWNEEPYPLPAILWLQGKGNQVMALQRIPILEEVCTTYSLITANYNEIVDYHSYIIPQYHMCFGQHTANYNVSVLLYLCWHSLHIFTYIHYYKLAQLLNTVTHNSQFYFAPV